MRLDDAIKRAEEAAKRLDGLDAAAVVSLVQLAKRVRRVQEPLRQLERALNPAEHMNQVELFTPDE